MCQNDGSAGEDTGRPAACDSPTEYESYRIRSGPADGGSDLEDKEGDEKNRLGGIEGIDATPEKLGGTACNQVGTGIPADVGEGVEVGCDAWYRGGDDGPILERVNGAINDRSYCFCLR